MHRTGDDEATSIVEASGVDAGVTVMPIPMPASDPVAATGKSRREAELGQQA